MSQAFEVYFYRRMNDIEQEGSFLGLDKNLGEFGFLEKPDALWDTDGELTTSIGARQPSRDRRPASPFFPVNNWGTSRLSPVPAFVPHLSSAFVVGIIDLGSTGNSDLLE